MKPSNEDEIQSGSVLLDGIGRLVRDTLYRLLMVSCPPLNSRYSTGGCCIVRTVFNGGSFPDDVTCAFPVPNSSRLWLILSKR